ncbi:hypothetical protein LCGC14_3159260, partial [marine sediment metagenome]
MSKGKIVLITGSCGFIGSNLVKACLKKGWEVIGVDNFSGSSAEMSEPERYSNLLGKYKFYEADVCETEYFTGLVEKHNPEVIFHLAALPRVSFSTDYPLESNHNNITGTLSVLEAARKVGVKRVVYSASSSMYGGESIPFPTPETTPAHPKSNYALQKYTGLEYCRLFSELYVLDTCSLIYFNVFGPGQLAGGSYSTVIPAFFHSALNDESCRIDGKTGDQSRDFCYVSNIVDANILASENKRAFCGDAFNIANGETHSVLEVYHQVKKIFCKDLKKHHVSRRLGDPQ